MSILKRIKRTVRLAKAVGIGVWVGAKLWRDYSTSDPEEMFCRNCGYEGTADRTFGADEERIGITEINGEKVPMWVVTDRRTLCYPCWLELGESELAAHDWNTTVEKFRRLQEEKDE